MHVSDYDTWFLLDIPLTLQPGAVYCGYYLVHVAPFLHLVLTNNGVLVLFVGVCFS